MKTVSKAGITTIIVAAANAQWAQAESYPNLKATESFRDLQAQLEGTENPIVGAEGGLPCDSIGKCFL